MAVFFISLKAPNSVLNLVLFLYPKGGDKVSKKEKEKGHCIFRKYIRNPKTDKIIYASAYGKKAFKIWVKD